VVEFLRTLQEEKMAGGNLILLQEQQSLKLNELSENWAF
jgi:hypothetical protein